MKKLSFFSLLLVIVLGLTFITAEVSVRCSQLEASLSRIQYPDGRFFESILDLIPLSDFDGKDRDNLREIVFKLDYLHFRLASGTEYNADLLKLYEVELSNFLRATLPQDPTQASSLCFDMMKIIRNSEMNRASAAMLANLPVNLSSALSEQPEAYYWQEIGEHALDISNKLLLDGQRMFAAVFFESLPSGNKRDALGAWIDLQESIEKSTNLYELTLSMAVGASLKASLMPEGQQSF